MKNNQTQKNIPSDWKQVKLGDIFEFKNGLNKEKKYFGKGTPIVNYVDVYNGGGLYQKTIGGLVEVDESEKARFNVKKGDVFFTRTSETLDQIGFSAVALDDFKETVFSGFVLRARPKNDLLLSNFAKYCFKTQYARQEIKEKSSYTTRALTSGSLLNHVKLPLPPLSEQNRIVAVLEVWDKAIEKMTKKIELKKEVKKGLMQELLTGKTRLKGFNDEWKNFKLGDLGEVRTSSVDKISRDGERKIGLLNYMDVYRRNKIFQSDPFQMVTANYNQLKSSNLLEGDILFTPSSETQIDIGHSAVVMENLKDVLFSYHLIRFRPKNNFLDKNFSAYAFKTKKFYRELWKRSQGVTRYTLSKDAISSSIINIPLDIEEQRFIAQILTITDKEIAKLEEKLKIIKEQKRYLLNNLITGDIRTPEDLLEKVNVR